jgi:flagellar biosynthesis/type III secretory pathway protein FliH
MEALLASPILWICIAAASEIIGLSPKLKSNSIVQLVFQVLGLLKSKKG